MTPETAILIGRLPSPPRYEPMIVTTLRSWHRRRAPKSLLRRLAGGEAHWRRLNAQWSIDGTAALVRALAAPDRPPPPDDDGEPAPRLSPDERTIMLGQIVRDYVAAGQPVPLHRLRRLFAISGSLLQRELSHLRQQGEIPTPLSTVDIDED
jgi:hypothetical protein